MKHLRLPLLFALTALATAAVAQDLRFADLGRCELESGGKIENCRIGYRTVGRLNENRSNAVLFPTWFAGSSEDILPLLGADGLIDASEFFVIVVDAFGNGVSSSPSNSRRQHGADFPATSIRDMVRQQRRLLEREFGLDALAAIVGISMGGMQAFEWSVSYPGFAARVVPIMGSPRLAVYDIVRWETQLRLHQYFLDCRCQLPAAILEAMNFLLRGPEHHARNTPPDALAQVRERLASATLSEDMVYDLNLQLQAMIAHDVSASFDGSLERAAAAARSEFLVVVGSLDNVVTPGPALEFARYAGSQVIELSQCGHRIPWCGGEQVNPAVRRFLSPLP